MVIRLPIVCEICGHQTILRIGLGHESVQEHVFACPGCAQDLSIVLDLSKPPNVGVARLSNIKEIVDNQELKSPTILNLHPEFIIPEGDRNRDQVFPWLEQGHALIKKQMNNLERSARLSDADSLLKDETDGRLTVFEAWQLVSRSWSLEIEGKRDLSKLQLAKYNAKGFSGSTSLPEVAFHFLSSALGPVAKELLLPAADCMGEAYDANPIELDRFREYYQTEQIDVATRDVYSVLEEFFRSYADFRQALVYVRFGLPLPSKAAATTENFRITSMYYGNAFEVLADRAVLLAGINNILAGRKYDQFEKMDLKTYLQIDKAGKARAFQSRLEFARLVNEFDNQLRNASHHKRIRINRGSGKIEYQTRQMAEAKKMSYATYLVRCCSITVNLAVIYMLELMLTVDPD